MPKFLAVYIGNATSEQKAEWEALGEEERAAREQAHMAAWGEWMMSNHASIIDPGSPIGPTKRAAREGIDDFNNRITGYTLVEAASHAEAAEMFRDHPHATLEPGNWIEVMECLSIPGSEDPGA